MFTGSSVIDVRMVLVLGWLVSAWEGRPTLHRSRPPGMRVRLGLGSLDIQGREKVSGYGLCCSLCGASFVGVLRSVIREADNRARLATVAQPAFVTGH